MAVASIDTSEPIEFLLPGSGNHYLDLPKNLPVCESTCGGNLPPNAPVSPVNNWKHSLFSQVDVSLNGTLVTPSTNTYAFRAFIETLLIHGAEAKIVS